MIQTVRKDSGGIRERIVAIAADGVGNVSRGADKVIYVHSFVRLVQFAGVTDDPDVLDQRILAHAQHRQISMHMTLVQQCFIAAQTPLDAAQQRSPAHPSHFLIEFGDREAHVAQHQVD